MPKDEKKSEGAVAKINALVLDAAEKKLDKAIVDKGESLGRDIKSRVMGVGSVQNIMGNRIENATSTEEEIPKNGGGLAEKMRKIEQSRGGQSQPITAEEYNAKQARSLGLKDTRSVERIKAEAKNKAQSRSQSNKQFGGYRGTSGNGMAGQASPSSRSRIGTSKEEEAKRRAEIMAEVHDRTAGKAASRLSGAGSGAKASFKGEINDKAKKEIEERMGKDLNRKQRFALRIASDVAGRRAVNALYAVARKMEEQAEKGGGMAIVMIGITYLMAGIKDVLDTVAFVIPGFSLALGIIFGTIISLFWLLICGSSHGSIVRWFVKKALTKILAAIVIDGLLGVIPTFLVMNAWNHWDYLKEIKKAERSLAEVNEKIIRVQRQVRANANSI